MPEFGTVIEGSPGKFEFGEVIEGPEQGQTTAKQPGKARNIANRVLEQAKRKGVQTAGLPLGFLGTLSSAIGPRLEKKTQLPEQIENLLGSSAASQIAPPSIEEITRFALEKTPGLKKAAHVLGQPPTEDELALAYNIPEPEGAIETGIRRGTSGAGAALASGIGPVGTAVLGGSGAAGGLVEGATGSRGLGTATELATAGLFSLTAPAFFKGGKFSHAASEILPSSERLGFSPDVVEALVKSPKKVEILAGGYGNKSSINRFADKARDQSNQAYKELYQSAFDLGAIPEGQRKSLATALEDKIKHLKRGPGLTSDEKKAINFVNQSVNRFKKRGYYTDIIKANKKLNEEGQRLKSPHLEKFKEDFFNTLEEASPQLAEDFDTYNRLYPGLLALEKAAVVKAQDPLKQVLKVGGGLALIATGHPLLAAGELLGPAAAQKLRHAYIQSPKLQRYGRNLAKFIKQGKNKQAEETSKAIYNELSEIERQEFLREDAIVKQELEQKKIREADRLRRQKANERAQQEQKVQQRTKKLEDQSTEYIDQLLRARNKKSN